jgi:hypothetical protein
MAVVFRKIKDEKLYGHQFLFKYEPKPKLITDFSSLDPDKQSTLKARENLLPFGLTRIIKVDAIETYKNGWRFHKSPHRWEEVVQQLQTLYPDNTYKTDHGCFLTENGVDVACHEVFNYDEKTKTVDEKKVDCECDCIVESFSVVSTKTEEEEKFGVADDLEYLHASLCRYDRVECKKQHDTSNFIQHERLTFPFYLFLDPRYQICRTLDGHLIRFVKENKSFVMYYDDEIIHSNYSPSPREQFEQTYPGPYKTISVTYAWGINRDNYKNLFKDENGTNFSFSTGMEYQCFPGFTEVIVPSSYAYRSENNIKKFIDEYKKVNMTEKRKQDYFSRAGRQNFTKTIKDWEDFQEWNKEYKLQKTKNRFCILL